jgi:hypothetical protein
MEHEFIGCDSETPPVNLPGIALLVEYLGCHVCHTPRDTCVMATLRIVDGDVEVGNMGMSSCIKKYVVWFEIAMNNALAVKILESTRKLRHPKSDNVLLDKPFSL